MEKTLSSRPLPWSTSLRSHIKSSRDWPVLRSTFQCKFTLFPCFDVPDRAVFRKKTSESLLLYQKPSCSSGRLLLSWDVLSMDRGAWETTVSVKRMGLAAKHGICKNKFQKTINGSVFQLTWCLHKHHVVSLKIGNVLNYLLPGIGEPGTWKLTPCCHLANLTSFCNIASILKISHIYPQIFILMSLNEGIVSITKIASRSTEQRELINKRKYSISWFCLWAYLAKSSP